MVVALNLSRKRPRCWRKERFMRTRTTTLWCSVALGGWMIGAANVAGATEHGFYAGVDGGVASYPYDVRFKVGGTPFDSNGTTYQTKSSHEIGRASCRERVEFAGASCTLVT